MELALLVYLASISTGISAVFAILGILLIILFLGALVYVGATYDVHDSTSNEDVRERKKAASFLNSVKKFGFIGLALFLLSIFIPSEKTIYIMAGAYATQQIATNDRVQKIGKNVLDVIENKLEKMKDEK